MLHANFTTLSSAEPELSPIEVLKSYIADIRNFALLCCCDLDLYLDPMTFTYELDPYPVKMFPCTKNELSTLRLSKIIVLHTNRHAHILPPKLSRRLASGNKQVLGYRQRRMSLMDNVCSHSLCTSFCLHAKHVP